MTCHDVKQHLYAYVDGTLPDTAGAEIRQHLDTCASCRQEVQAVTDVEGRIRAVFHDAAVPATLWPRITAALADSPSTTGKERRHTRRVAYLPAIAAVLLLALGVLFYQRLSMPWASLETRLASVPVQDMHTFVVSQRPLDFASADPQQLRQWFQAKVDFLPPLLPAQAGTATLSGGRLCYFLERRVASFMYTANGHSLSLYVMSRRGLPLPRDRQAVALPSATVYEVQGYTHLIWSHTDLLYSLVSDLPTSQLLEVAQLFTEAG